MTMTFEAFQATRTKCDDLGLALSDARWDEEAHKARGNLYLGCLYIEEENPGWADHTRAKGRWYLQIGNCETVSNDLPALERELYDWAMAEGYGDDEAREG